LLEKIALYFSVEEEERSVTLVIVCYHYLPAHAIRIIGPVGVGLTKWADQHYTFGVIFDSIMLCEPSSTASPFKKLTHSSFPSPIAAFIAHATGHQHAVELH
jgi:hypothetical protein